MPVPVDYGAMLVGGSAFSIAEKNGEGTSSGFSQRVRSMSGQRKARHHRVEFEMLKNLDIFVT
jgi:hypothetical protein